jgi:ADP-ribose pyrophosphatase YjhB (NUDIX family)
VAPESSSKFRRATFCRATSCEKLRRNPLPQPETRRRQCARVPGAILLCKRGIEPRLGTGPSLPGLWKTTETLEAGAAREALEEARIDVEIGSLLLLANVTHARQVHVFFRSRMRSPDFGVTHESLEVALVDEKDIPWSDLALPEHRICAAAVREDRKAGVDRHHVAQMQRRFYVRAE